MSKSGTAAGTGNNRALPGPCSIVDAHVQVGLRGDSFGMDAFSDYFMAQPAFKVFLAYAGLRELALPRLRERLRTDAPGTAVKPLLLREGVKREAKLVLHDLV